MCVCVYIYIYIYTNRYIYSNIYIYIYIYCHPQTDCVVVSQLFSVARHVGYLKLGSKPAQLYVRLSIRLLGQQAYHVWLGNYKVLWSKGSISVHLVTFYTLPDTRVFNSFEELCIMQAAAENSFPRVLNPHGEAYLKRSHDYGISADNDFLTNGNQTLQHW